MIQGSQRRVRRGSVSQAWDSVSFLSVLGLVSLSLWASVFILSFSSAAQQPPPAPPASGARILLLPRRIVAGEHTTLAVLDVNGRLTPGVTVTLSSGDRVTTDSTGRARFVAPLAPGVLLGALEGRPGQVPSRIVSPADAPSEQIRVQSVPRYAALGDRFEISGTGFCGDADANQVTIAERSALVLASSPASLVLLPPEVLAAGPATVKVACGRRAAPTISMTFVSLGLSDTSSTLAPGERRDLLVHIRGTSEHLIIEARNLAPDIADLTGGNPVRVTSTGGPENSARLEVVGRTRGSFLISIRLLSPLTSPRP